MKTLLHIYYYLRASVALKPLLLLLLLPSSFLFGMKNDSIPRKKSTQNDTWFYENEPNRKTLIDSSIYRIHRYDMVRNDGEEYFNLGNTGTAAYPIIFHPQPRIGFNYGMRQLDPYRYIKDSIRYYQLIRPYVELSYTLGLHKEQVFRGQFANSHKKTLYYGTDFHVINSPGSYLNQTAYVGGCNVYGVYHSPKNTFDVLTNLLYNEYKTRENGGLTADIFYRDSALFQKTLAPVKFQNAATNHNELQWYLKGTYNIGSHYQVRINDSTLQRTLLPVFKISYQFDIEKDKYRFLNKPMLYGDSTLLAPYVGAGDSLSMYSRLLKVGNTVYFDFDAKKITSDTTFRELNFLMGAFGGIDYYQITEKHGTYKFVNSYVGGYLKSNPALHSRFIYNATARYYFSGYNRNDLLADGSVGVDFRKFGTILASVSYQLRQSDYIFHSLQTEGFQWKNSFPKMSVLRFGGSYQVPSIGISVSAFDHVLGNYFYVNANKLPAFESKPMNVLVLNFSNRFAIKGFHLDNDIWFQKASGSDVIRLPLFVTKHSVYYEARVFKRVLWLAFGVDLRWYSNFTGNGYDPVSGQFYLQNDLTLKYYPVLDVFLNMKIKSLRVFLVGSNLSRGIKQSGYYPAYLYPAQDIGFKFGVKWRFFE